MRLGMTLLEVLITISILAMLAVVLIPAIRSAMAHRENVEAAHLLRKAVSAFELYSAEQGAFPADRTPAVVPPEMSAYYFPYYQIDWWTQKTPVGGYWDWDAGYHYAFSVSIHAPERSLKQLQNFDRLIDDGNLETGSFRRHGNHYHYIIEE
jgi:prepilin-type N-terminal cleavage/methylation domain-containing protein